MEKAWRCMDETALIAFGILMEEMGNEMLGETGDLAFTEAAVEVEEQEMGHEDQADGQGKSAQRSATAAPEKEEEQRPGLLSSEDDASEVFEKRTLFGVGRAQSMVVVGGAFPFESRPLQRRKAHPKIQANPQKAATILAWFHKTAQAHSIKDLEKTLPQVGAISGMHVKDYLQALSDDNKIRVEKIGSGNWYWSFISDEKKAKDAMLSKAQEEYNKINVTVAELQAKVDEAGAARAEDEDVLTETGGDRKTLITKHGDLTKELDKLRTELAAYSEQDPVEVEKKAAETQKARDEAMESWIKKQGIMAPADLEVVLKMLYGDEYDEEEGGLRDDLLYKNRLKSKFNTPRWLLLEKLALQLERRNNRVSLRVHNGAVEVAEDVEEEVLLDQKTDLSMLVAEAEAGATLTMGVGADEANKGKAPVAETEQQGQILATVPKVVLPQDDDDDAEVCFICASPVQHTAVAPCNHRTCHICSIRMRALYKTKACAHCRTESDHVILTDDTEKNYESFDAADFFQSNDSLGIHFENPQAFDDTRLLLQYNCPEGDCDVACLGWPDLHRHVKTAHRDILNVAFAASAFMETTSFTLIAETSTNAVTFAIDYYVNYDSLEVHFKKDHFLCPDRECLDKKFVVFDSEMDLKAHQIESHPNGLTKDALRDARRVDMSGFQFRAPHEQDNGGRRDDRRREGGRGRGRGRDPNAEPLPASSAQTLSRAELAYQRQMEAQNSTTGTTRAFGGQLTAPTPGEAFAARPPPNASEPPTVTASRPPVGSDLANGVGQLSLNAQSTASAPQTPQEQARLLRHNAVIERATGLLRNDAPKLQEFRSSISAYRNSKTSATQLIEGFFALFDTNSKEIGKLIKELADIFEIPAKREGLLKAWNDWKAINEDYPSLPGSSALNGSVITIDSQSEGKLVLPIVEQSFSCSASCLREPYWGEAWADALGFLILCCSKCTYITTPVSQHFFSSLEQEAECCSGCIPCAASSREAY
ncbi:hypothetical protein SNOG_03682 [Parastagonospora nodorum SN15]|uniref:RING-type E3 ubiquitin transferase n=1 Tax=Phaeosphaeria nodorum (strain SN15 / ATCC MYA-4574 / FGSC 10173) TaxID=321614 RepID=Q0UX32_PHANO|nr:hypothetical protein SNOG_03682 [Parastagonospora nodorum SN15]EAT88887.2 hypothetical protein SNOG_03682 [Parastagonospora nodorum SN15]